MIEREWRVVWEIDSTATTPLEAAVNARGAQTREGTTAVVFDVFDRKRNIARRVDLQAPDGSEVESISMSPRIVIVVLGGCVKSVFADCEISVTVVDAANMKAEGLSVDTIDKHYVKQIEGLKEIY